MRPHDPQHGQHCLYPPRVAEEVDVTQQTEAGETRYVVRNRVTSRYFLLKPTEYRVFCQINGAQTINQIAQGGESGAGPRVSTAGIVKFLARLDSLDLLGRGGLTTAAQATKRGMYMRVHLFNPDRLLGWVDRTVGWALTRPFILGSFLFMACVALAMVARSEEVAAYTSYTYAEYGLAAILAVTLTVTALHEFAHGLACKHFGGEVPEVGFLMIFYVLPAFYCNVSDIYRLGKRQERLWVIAAGIYWQMLASAFGAAIWLIATPLTPISDGMFLLFLGGTFNIIINCNPLIKLDGYYALSQVVGVQNLQARSSAYVGSLLTRLLEGRTPEKSQGEHRRLFVAYWVASVLYSVALIWLILGWVGDGLMNWMGFFGVLLTLALAALLTEKWWRPVLKSITREIKNFGATTMSAQPAREKTETANPATEKPRKNWAVSRPRAIKWGLALAVIAVLVAPWEASTGSDCTLLLPPGRESIARANTDGVLGEILVQPGDTVAAGTRIARLGNPEIEDRLTQLNSEIERLTANTSRLEDELRVRSEMSLSANFKEHDRKRLADELRAESTQIASARALPPQLAVLQSEIELRQTELEHNRREVERYKKLYDDGLVGGQQYDRAVAAMRLSEKEVERARALLEAAMVEHRRTTTGAETSSLVAETEARAARSSFEALIAELHANRQQSESLRQRRDILQREYDGMVIQAPGSGVILGDDLRKMIGKRYTRGEEICRIGELEKFLLRIDVSEREIANVKLDSPVRFKLKTVPGRTFTGRVSKINAEPVPNQYGQRFYPVEVMVENSDGLLRPGMTGYARISFGRESIGLIIGDKIWQALRPELWLF